jgi:hypothetical protein
VNPKAAGRGKPSKTRSGALKSTESLVVLWMEKLKAQLASVSPAGLRIADFEPAGAEAAEAEE